MGKLLIKKASKSVMVEKSHDLSKKEELYKPLSEFTWKNASPAEIHQNSIKAYKKYAF